jgi:hypothetical protein
MHLVRSANGATFIDEQHLVRPMNLRLLSLRNFDALRSPYKICALVSAIV